MNKLKVILRVFLFCLFLLGLIYLLWPGPSKISDFPPLPDSLKSTEEGDTIQIPNVSAYFSDHDRQYVTNYYRKYFEYIHIFSFTLPAIRLNHPPETAYTYIRDQQRSTYLEEYSYPFRDSLFVNGLEPVSKEGKLFLPYWRPLHIDGKYYFSKATLRFYPSSAVARVAVYVLLWISVVMLVNLYMKAIREV